ncbi:HigA family addiction module antitoxin [Azotobacter chroococcum]|uniref:HigA family addiction module antitoxin n=1 Tax=Azotobacter chroococcum TaxID=353 RepID=UPI0010ADF1AF|nr:HigA family addiction module antitoxin [Azotobacter chroococcum]TKD44213.1 addiction module antidote protein, HigA family [Azotobacter chroococcum]
MAMHNPPHPGEILREDVLPELGIEAAEIARRLHYSHEMLLRILHGQAPVSPDFAVRLERAGIGTARLWLSAQTAFDLWQAEHREKPPTACE